MNTEHPTLEALMKQTLEGTLTEAQRSQLQDFLRADPQALESYCQQMRIHALLAWRSGNPAKVEMTEPAKVIAMPTKNRKIISWLGAAAAMVALITAGLLFFSPKSAEAASVALERMISVAARGGDRTFQLKVLAGENSMRLINNQSASYDGALLHVGRGGHFVYECDLSDGTRRISGSDGVTSWDIIGPAPVHLSNDPSRFSHHLPGQQENFTFLDPYAQLAMLRDGYDVSYVDESNPAFRTIKAVRRGKEFRGPKEARIAFNEKTKAIHSIDLIGLPRQRGGPSALRLTLIAERTFPPGFFTHELHHESGRRIELEPASRPPR
jgi:hypothetical protein